MVPSDKAPRRVAYGLGVGLTLTAVGFLLLPGSQRFYAPGPPTPGHETTACADCHRPAPGTPRQQIQANVQHLLGRRAQGAAFLHGPVKNEHCQSCHRNDMDRHPTYRFNEPRFEAVRGAIAPQECVSCHREHAGRRVTVAAGFCDHCHQNVTLPADPARPTHQELIGAGQWGACLRCHDYHGHHTRPTPRTLPDEVTEQKVRDYFAGDPSPYGEPARLPVGQKGAVAP